MMTYGNGVTVERAKRCDMQPIIDNICKGDAMEAEALGISHEYMVRSSIDNSIEAYTIKKDGKVLSLFGLTKRDLLDNKAIFWILSTDEIYTVSRKLIRHSLDYINKWLNEYSELYNFIHSDNLKALRWARMLGARLEIQREFGINGEDFYKFTFSRKEVAIKKVMDNSVALNPRDKIMMFEKFLAKQDGAIYADSPDAPPLRHDFTDGMYTRTISIPKGMMLTGKIHKHDHPNFLMKGKVEVYTEHEGLEVLEAPLIIMSKAGTKRVVHTLEETVWATVHLNPTNTHDVDKLESEIIAKNYEEITL